MEIVKPEFWQYALERAVKTAAQTASAYLAGGMVTLFEVDWSHAAGLTGLAFVASVLTSLGTPEDTRDARVSDSEV